MIKKFQILNIEKASYTSDLNEEGLKKKIKELFTQSQLRVDGKLTSENEFTAYDKFVVIGWDMPNLRRKSAYLNGTISKKDNGTLLQLRVNPNSILPIFAILSALTGVAITILAISNIMEYQFLILFGSIFIVLGIIYYLVSTFFRNRLRKRFLKYLDLQKV